MTFLGDLCFDWFSDDLFLMKVNTDRTTFGFNVLMWRPALTFISVYQNEIHIHMCYL